MISFLSKEWVVWAIVGLLSLIGMWAYGQHRFGQGVHSRDLEVSNLNTQIAGAAVALNGCNDATKANVASAAAQRAMADAALNAALDHDKGRTKELATAVDNLNAARKTDDCKAASETRLCKAMLSY